MNNVLTVTQINTYIKSLLDGSDVLRHVYLSGEISNLTAHYKSGHIYLSLKDDRSAMKAVMFAASAKRLRFTPKDGMKVLVRGRISVYEASGQYQFYVEDMQPDGLGALNLAFEQLKERLFAEGLFSQEHKQAIPTYPTKIAVITSPTGAAVQDIFKILGRRWPMAELLFAPCTVQGDRAVPELLAALKAINKEQGVQVIIIGRGGGSLEDLWAFNSEKLARAIFALKIPVVSAVGHETDFTICDLVADLRASTPSAAAELVTPDAAEESERVRNLSFRLQSAIRSKVADSTIRLDRLTPLPLLGNRLIKAKAEMVKSTVRLLSLTAERSLSLTGGRVGELSGKLDALSPLKVLHRGYAVLMADNHVLVGVSQVKNGDIIKATLSDGSMQLRIEGIEHE